MMNTIRIGVMAVFVSLILLKSSSEVICQSETYVVSDLETWSEVEAKFKLTKKLNLSISQALRLENNASQYNQTFTNLYAGYKFSKGFGLKTGLRVINEADEETVKSNYLRYFMSATTKYEVSRFDIHHRLMFTNKNELGISKEEGDEHINQLRFRTGAEYKIKNWKFDPVGSIEIFRKYENGDSEWNKIRFRLGTELKLKSFGEVGVFYAIEQEFGKSIQPTNYIIGLNYSYTFKLNKKK